MPRNASEQTFHDGRRGCRGAPVHAHRWGMGEYKKKERGGQGHPDASYFLPPAAGAAGAAPVFG